MPATPSVFLMTSFLFLSFSETPSIHHSILISVLSSSPSSLLVTDQASAPYISTRLIIVLNTFPFRYFGILQHTKPARSFHFCQAALILFLTSCSQPPLAFITDPRYLNVSVCFNKCPALSLIISVSFVLAQTIVSVFLMLILRPLLSRLYPANQRNVSVTLPPPCQPQLDHPRTTYPMALPFL